MAKERVVREVVNPYTTGEVFAEMFEGANSNLPQEGTVVKGYVVKVEKDVVTIDVGAKTEGRVLLKDFPLSEREAIKEGDEVEVFLERIENMKNEAVVSRERAVREEAWERLEKLHAKEEQVKGVIFGRVKGGFTVEIEGAVAFLPGSQVDVRPVKDVSPLMGIEQPFMILKMDRKRGNIVVSRRAVLEESRSEERAAALTNIREGMTVEGIVKNITDYGAFIDLGAIDGLLHVTDISWKRISHPSEVLSVAQKINVKIIKFDRETQRISLGLKQMESSPWEAAAAKYALRTKHRGTVTNVTDYGAFVELEAGIEGLVHVSEMSWTKKNIHPNKIVSIGQEVEVMILSIDQEKHRLSLGIKQCTSNPWEGFAAKYKKGDILEGEIKSITDFGLFVGLEGDVDGLVHVSDVAWGSNPDQAMKEHKKGGHVKVQVLDIDPNKERVSLGIKQLQEKPAGLVESTEQPRGDSRSEARSGGRSDEGKGKVATFIVAAVTENGIEVTVGEGKVSFIKKAELANDRVECRPERFSVGDRVDAKIIGVDKDGLPKLSIKAMEQDAEKKAIAEYGSADSGASLGGILGVALESAKEDAVKKEEKAKAKAKKAAATSDDAESSDEPKKAAKKPAAKKAKKAE